MCCFFWHADNIMEYFNLLKDENYRIDTFNKNWPHGYPLTPKLLARHGFYYNGESDTIKCCECKLTLTNLKPNQFIDRFHERFKCSYANVRTFEYCIQNNLPYSNENEKDVVSKLVAVKSSSTIPEKLEQNDSQNCNICMSNVINACLVPCGHMLCLECALELNNTICPYCRNVSTIQKLYVN
ncbi:IAP-1 [Buzura suppressaria nucleopolyhedrovirus]|uniref:IAP-1 n=1 Tax=Buzura suppressaria nuclear polyhedrosis virus TaxID=74320 RepID=W5VS52_NPVBS|nr:IAP-1 [Buzura suppressaria nucleopolyhedrovirus]AHH82637.1 IAP-1 [Buzura suppressaria nucleopolyhedrovirus]